MKRFWEKTKNNFTLGVGTAMDVTGAKKLPEDPEITRRAEKLSFYKKHVKDMQKSITELSASITNLGDSQNETSDYFSKIFENENGTFQSNSLRFAAVSESVKAICGAESTQIISTNEQISEILTEIQELKTILEKRKKNLILIDSIDTKIQKLEEKNQPISEDLRLNKEKRTTKFNSYHSSFIARFDALETKVQNTYSTILTQTKQSYSTSITQMNNGIPKDFEDFIQSTDFPKL